MKNNTHIIIVVLIILGLAIVTYASVQTKSPAMIDDKSMENHNMMMKDEKMDADKGMMKDTTQKDSEMMMVKSGTYSAYAPEKVTNATGDTVLFFRAPWCPACQSLEKDIQANLEKIPVSLTILDVDYDSSKDLKKKYGVTYQHTFVQVDKAGTLIKKWSGSGTLSALVVEVK